MSYKIYFIGRDGKERKIEEDSYSTIRNIHANIKYNQKLDVTNILKPHQQKKTWLSTAKDVITFKKKKGGS